MSGPERTVSGVGYLGATSSRREGRKKLMYTRWKNMIHRCYKEDCPVYYRYGGRGTEVCERWKCFANFERDVKRLSGYGEFNSFDNSEAGIIGNNQTRFADKHDLCRKNINQVLKGTKGSHYGWRFKEVG